MYGAESRACRGVGVRGWNVKTELQEIQPHMLDSSWEDQELVESRTSIIFFFCFASLRW